MESLATKRQLIRGDKVGACLQANLETGSDRGAGHGWTGPLGTDRDGVDSEGDLEGACEALNEGLRDLMGELAGLPPATGTLTARLYVSGTTGRVDRVIWLTDTVVPLWSPGYRGEDGAELGDARAAILRAARRHLSDVVFPATQQGGRLEL